MLIIQHLTLGISGGNKNQRRQEEPSGFCYPSRHHARYVFFCLQCNKSADRGTLKQCLHVATSKCDHFTNIACKQTPGATFYSAFDTFKRYKLWCRHRNGFSATSGENERCPGSKHKLEQQCSHTAPISGGYMETLNPAEWLNKMGITRVYPRQPRNTKQK